MSASTARHEIRALLRAHLAAASAYRHLTRYCVVCHRLLRLAMEPGGDGAAGPATGRSTPPGTPPTPPAGRSTPPGDHPTPPTDLSAPPAGPPPPPARPSTPSVDLSPPAAGSPRPPARPSAASVGLAAPAARPSAASGAASEARRRPDGGTGSPGGAEDAARAPGPKRTERPGKRSAEERSGAERPSPT
ncbi:DUF6274 family protein [Streptomyces californicus]|uniref:DUF6274 family protein n=1 Tax=Streptomyces californicus TaxID=67351 RepID=UPI003F541259